jgi:hypothetical protein
MIPDGLNKRLYDEKRKKRGKWINEISSVVWGLRTQPSKATGHSHFFLVYRSEAIRGNLLDWRCKKKVRLMTQDILNLTRQKKSDSMFCFRRPATYKAPVITMTGMFNNDLSTLEIWSFAASRMRLGCTSLILDGRDPSLRSRLQDQGRIAYSTLMV